MAHGHATGCGAAIYLSQPGANTRVRSWTPTPQAQYGFLVTHNKSISIADYFTLRDAASTRWSTGRPATTPITRATTRCCRCTNCSAAPGSMQDEHHILDEHEIVDGIDELGVLIYGHAKNAYWYGSQLSVEETRQLAPYQNATGLQVTSAVLAGMVWALENPERGIVEADEMDFRRCLEIQRPYLGPVIGTYTDWTPLTGPARPVSGKHRSGRPVAVPQRAGRCIAAVIHGCLGHNHRDFGFACCARAAE